MYSQISRCLSSAVRTVVKVISLFTKSLAAGAATILLVSTGLSQQSVSARSVSYELNIPAENLDAALQAVALASHHKLFYRAELVAGKASKALIGSYTTEEAVHRLLEGTQLSFEITPASVVLIKALDDKPVTVVPNSSGGAAQIASPGPSDDASTKGGGKQSSQEFRLAQVGQGKTTSDVPVDKSNEQAENRKTEGLEEIIVTGTHIHNVAPISPVMTITHDDIVRQGYTKVAEIIDQLPQNFMGGVTPGANALNNVGGLSGNNVTFASGINLRGLGPSATLVLLNGRRIATAGVGGFADISNIPVNMIDRIEIVTDGASSVYGADAVAGVVNIITRQEFSGVQVGAGLTGISKGKTPDHDANVLTGFSWGRGGMVASLDYEKDNPLYARNRSFTDGLTDPWALSPKNEKMNVYLSAHQSLTDALTLSGDAFAARRNFDVTANTFGQYGAPYPVADNGRANVYSASLQLDYRISSDWAATLIGQVSKEQDRQFTYDPPLVFANFPSPFAGAQPSFSRVASLESRLDGKLFELPGGAVRTAIGAQFLQESFELKRYRGTLDDPYGNEPGTTDGTPNGLQAQFTDSRHVSSAYGEISIPLIGKDNGVPFVRGLRINVSGRYDKYSDFGSTTNPRFALEWEPLTDATLHATYSRSFQVPSYLELSAPRGALVLPMPDPRSATGSTLVALTGGGNADLRPETAKTLNFGITYEPHFVQGLKVDAAYFHINFDNQIIQIGDFSFFTNSLQEEATLGPNIVQRNPSLTDITQALNVPSGQLTNYAGGNFQPGPYVPSDIGAIVRGAYVNSAASTVAGEDLQVRYRIPETKVGSFLIDVDASYFNRYEFNLSSTAAGTSFLNTTLNPLRFRAKADFGWSRSAWGANARVNFSNSYKNTADTTCTTTNSCPSVSSWTTVDLNAFYAPPSDMGPKWLEDTRVTLIVTNVFNRDPPLVTGLTNPLGYDPYNANPFLRVFGVTFTKRFGHGQ